MFIFSENNKKKIEEILTHYPLEHQESAVLPVLKLAQHQNDGWISPEVISCVAELLKIPEIRVWEIVTFYSLFNLKPTGLLVEVCTTLPCWLRGADEVLKACQSSLSQEGAPFHTLREVECIGRCTEAPVLMIGKKIYPDTSPEKIYEILGTRKSFG